MPIPSPCIGVCDATDTTRCTGCARKMIQIVGWNAAPDNAKVQFINRANQAGLLTPEQQKRYPWLTPNRCSSTGKRITAPVIA